MQSHLFIWMNAVRMSHKPILPFVYACHIRSRARLLVLMVPAFLLIAISSLRADIRKKK